MPNFYYTDTNNQKHFISDQQLRELVARGLITPHTPLETEGGHKGLAGQIPGLFDAVPASPFTSNASTGNYGARVTSHNSTDVIKRLNTLFILFLICTIVALVFYIPSAFLNAIPEDSMDETESIGVAFIGFLLLIPFIVSWVFEFMLLYQLWKQIPPSIARTTPGKAVGFSFIPFFNFYWWFVAFWGLCQDMNQTIQRRGIQYQVNEGLGLATCIFFFVHIILSIPMYWAPPVLSIPFDILMTLANSVILIFFFKSVKDGAIAILEQG